MGLVEQGKRQPGEDVRFTAGTGQVVGVATRAQKTGMVAWTCVRRELGKASLVTVMLLVMVLLLLVVVLLD